MNGEIVCILQINIKINYHKYKFIYYIYILILKTKKMKTKLVLLSLFLTLSFSLSAQTESTLKKAQLLTVEKITANIDKIQTEKTIIQLVGNFTPENAVGKLTFKDETGEIEVIVNDADKLMLRTLNEANSKNIFIIEGTAVKNVAEKIIFETTKISKK